MKLYTQTFALVLLVSLLSHRTFAKAPELKKLSFESLKIEPSSGYNVLRDHIYGFKGLGKGNIIVFFADAKRNEESDSEERSPRLFAYKDNILVDSFSLPDVDPAWHLSAVKTFKIDEINSSGRIARFLVRLTMEPPAGPAHSWDQTFIFGISREGKISFDTKLNKTIR